MEVVGGSSSFNLARTFHEGAPKIGRFSALRFAFRLDRFVNMPSPKSEAQSSRIASIFFGAPHVQWVTRSQDTPS